MSDTAGDVQPFWIGEDLPDWAVKALSLILAGYSWPEGSETGAFNSSRVLDELVTALDRGADRLAGPGQALASGAGWDAPATREFEPQLHDQLYGPDGLVGAYNEVRGFAQQAAAFGMNLQYSKVMIVITVLIALISLFLTALAAFITGGASLAGEGAIVAAARQSIAGELRQLAVSAAEKYAATTVKAEIVRQTVENVAITLGTDIAQHVRNPHAPWDWHPTFTMLVAGGLGFGMAKPIGKLSPLRHLSTGTGLRGFTGRALTAGVTMGVVMPLSMAAANTITTLQLDLAPFTNPESALGAFLGGFLSGTARAGVHEGLIHGGGRLGPRTVRSATATTRAHFSHPIYEPARLKLTAPDAATEPATGSTPAHEPAAEPTPAAAGVTESTRAGTAAGPGGNGPTPGPAAGHDPARGPDHEVTAGAPDRAQPTSQRGDGSPSTTEETTRAKQSPAESAAGREPAAVAGAPARPQAPDPATTHAHRPTDTPAPTEASTASRGTPTPIEKPVDAPPTTDGVRQPVPGETRATHNGRPATHETKDPANPEPAARPDDHDGPPPPTDQRPGHNEHTPTAESAAVREPAWPDSPNGKPPTAEAKAAAGHTSDGATPPPDQRASERRTAENRVIKQNTAGHHAPEERAPDNRPPTQRPPEHDAPQNRAPERHAPDNRVTKQHVNEPPSDAPPHRGHDSAARDRTELDKPPEHEHTGAPTDRHGREPAADARAARQASAEARIAQRHEVLEPLLREHGDTLPDAVLHEMAHSDDLLVRDAAMYQSLKQNARIDLRWTQDAAIEELSTGRSIDQKCGEGKTYVVSGTAQRRAVESGAVHVMTSSKTLADKDVEAHRAILQPLGTRVERVDPDTYLPEPARGERVVYVGAKRDFAFYRLKQSVRQLGLLQAAREHFPVRVPGHDLIRDEGDAGNNESYHLSDGASKPASRAAAARRDWAAGAMKTTFTDADLSHGRLTLPGRAKLADAFADRRLARLFGKDPITTAERLLIQAHAADTDVLENRDYLVDHEVLVADATTGQRLDTLDYRVKDGLLHLDIDPAREITLTDRVSGHRLIPNRDYALDHTPDGTVVHFAERRGKIAPIDRNETGDPMLDLDTNLEQRFRRDELAPALEAKFGLPIRTDSAKSMVLHTPELLEGYTFHVALSGTAKAAEPALRALGVTEVVEIPRFHDTPSPVRPDRLYETEADAVTALIDHIVQLRQAGNHDPILIPAHDNRYQADIARELINRGVPRDAVQLRDAQWKLAHSSGDARAAAMHTTAERAAEPDMITIGGLDLGRGFDVKAGDLHVLATTRAHDSARNDEQLALRANRNGATEGNAIFFSSWEHPLLQRYEDHPAVGQLRADHEAAQALPEDHPTHAQLGLRHAEVLRQLQDAAEHGHPIAEPITIPHESRDQAPPSAATHTPAAPRAPPPASQPGTSPPDATEVPGSGPAVAPPTEPDPLGSQPDGPAAPGQSAPATTRVPLAPASAATADAATAGTASAHSDHSAPGGLGIREALTAQPVAIHDAVGALADYLSRHGAAAHTGGAGLLDGVQVRVGDADGGPPAGAGVLTFSSADLADLPQLATRLLRHTLGIHRPDLAADELDQLAATIVADVDWPSLAYDPDTKQFAARDLSDRPQNELGIPVALAPSSLERDGTHTGDGSVDDAISRILGDLEDATRYRAGPGWPRLRGPKSAEAVIRAGSARRVADEVQIAENLQHDVLHVQRAVAIGAGLFEITTTSGATVMIEFARGQIGQRETFRLNGRDLHLVTINESLDNPEHVELLENGEAADIVAEAEGLDAEEVAAHRRAAQTAVRTRQLATRTEGQVPPEQWADVRHGPAADDLSLPQQRRPAATDDRALNRLSDPEVADRLVKDARDVAAVLIVGPGRWRVTTTSGATFDIEARRGMPAQRLVETTLIEPHRFEVVIAADLGMPTDDSGIAALKIEDVEALFFGEVAAVAAELEARETAAITAETRARQVAARTARREAAHRRLVQVGVTAQLRLVDEAFGRPDLIQQLRTALTQAWAALIEPSATGARIAEAGKSVAHLARWISLFGYGNEAITSAMQDVIAAADELRDLEVAVPEPGDQVTQPVLSPDDARRATRIIVRGRQLDAWKEGRTPLPLGPGRLIERWAGPLLRRRGTADRALWLAREIDEANLAETSPSVTESRRRFEAGGYQSAVDIAARYGPTMPVEPPSAIPERHPSTYRLDGPQIRNVDRIDALPEVLQSAMQATERVVVAIDPTWARIAPGLANVYVEHIGRLVDQMVVVNGDDPQRRRVILDTQLADLLGNPEFHAVLRDAKLVPILGDLQLLDLAADPGELRRRARSLRDAARRIDQLTGRELPGGGQSRLLVERPDRASTLAGEPAHEELGKRTRRLAKRAGAIARRADQGGNHARSVSNTAADLVAVADLVTGAKLTQLGRLLTNLAATRQLPEYLEHEARSITAAARQAGSDAAELAQRAAELVRGLTEHAAANARLAAPGGAALEKRTTAISDAVDQIGELVSTVAELEHTRLVAELVIDPDLGETIKELVDEAHAKGVLLTGDPVDLVEPPIIIHEADATADDILRDDQPVEEQPDLVVYIGGAAGLAHLAETAEQNRSAALDRVPLARIADLPREQQEELLRRVRSDTPPPPRRPADDGLARIADNAPRIADDAEHVAAIHRGAADGNLVTTRGGNQFLWGVQRGRPTEEQSAQNQYLDYPEMLSVATTISDDPGPEVRDAYGYEDVNRGVEAEWVQVVATGQLEQIAYTVDVLDGPKRGLDLARDAVARLAAPSSRYRDRLAWISRELGELRAHLYTTELIEVGRLASEALTAAAADLQEIARTDDNADVVAGMDTVIAATRSLLDAVTTLSAPDTLRPAFGVHDSYSRRDRGAITELRVRVRLLHEWLHGPAGPSANPVTRWWHGRRAREARIAELLGRLGLGITAPGRDELRDLLIRMGDRDIVEIADEYGRSRKAKPLEPTTVDEWWLAQTAPDLARAARASSIEPVADNVYLVRRGTRQFTVEILLDTLPARDPERARWEVASHFARAVQLDTLAEAERVSAAEMAERAANGRLGTDILTPHALSGLVSDETPLSPNDHAALGWGRAFREDYESAGFRDRFRLRRRLKEFKEGKGIGQRSAVFLDMAGLRESPDRQPRLAAVGRVDSELAEFVQSVGRRWPTLRSLAEPGIDRVMRYEPRWDESYLEPLLGWLRVHLATYSENMSVRERDGTIVVTLLGDDTTELAITPTSGHLFGPDHQLAAGQHANSYDGVTRAGIERRRGELAIVDLIFDTIGRHAESTVNGVPAGVVANLALRQRHAAENPDGAIRSRLKSDLQAYRHEVEDADVDLTQLPPELLAFLEANSRHVPQHVRKRRASVAAQVQEIAAAIEAGEPIPSRVPTLLRYTVSQLMAFVPIGLGSAALGYFAFGNSPWLAGLGFAAALPLAFAYAHQKRAAELATEVADNRKLADRVALREREAQRAAEALTVLLQEAVRPFLEELVGRPVPAPMREWSGTHRFAGRPPDPATGKTSFKQQLQNNKRPLAMGQVQATAFTGAAAGQWPLALATMGAQLFQFFFLAVGESMRSGFRIQRWHEQRAFDDARSDQSKALEALARELVVGLTALFQAAGLAVPPSSPDVPQRADVRAGEPVHALRPYRSLTARLDWRQRFPGYTVPFGAAAGLTAVVDPAAAFVTFANAIFTGVFWPFVQSIYDALEEHPTDRLYNQYRNHARAGSRRSAVEQANSVIGLFQALLQQLHPAPEGGWPLIPGQPLAQHVSPEQPAPVMPSRWVSHLLPGSLSGAIEFWMVLSGLLLPFANSTHAQQTLQSGAAYTFTTSAFGVEGDRILLDGLDGLQGLTAAQAGYRTQLLDQRDERALTIAIARLRDWIADAFQDVLAHRAEPAHEAGLVPAVLVDGAYWYWLNREAGIADAPKPYMTEGDPDRLVRVGELERMIGSGTARFQTLMAPTYLRRLTLARAWDAIAEKVSRATSEQPGHVEGETRQSAHGAYAVVVVRLTNGDTRVIPVRYYDPADPAVPAEQRGVYYFDPRSGAESREPMAAIGADAEKISHLDVLVANRSGDPMPFAGRPRGTFTAHTLTPPYLAVLRRHAAPGAEGPLHILQVASEFPSAGIHVGGLGTAVDATVEEEAKLGHHETVLVPQPLAADPAARAALPTRWHWLPEDRATPQMRELVRVIVAGLREAFAHQADKLRDDEKWARGAGDDASDAWYDVASATGTPLPDIVVVHDWPATQILNALRNVGIPAVGHVHAEEATLEDGDVSSPLIARKVQQEGERYQALGHVFVNSNKMKALVSWLFGIAPSKITVVANGTDLGDQLRASRDPGFAEELARQDPKFDEVRKRLDGIGQYALFVGRNHPLKGIEDSLQAWTKVKKAFPGVPLAIAGFDRAAAPRLMDQLVAEGRLVESDVIFLGWQGPELRMYIASRAALGVVPSHWEADGIVAKEFAALDIPVAATSQIDFTEQGWTGLQVPPRDPHALARAVRRILRYPGKAAAMAQLAHDKVRHEYYTWRRTAETKTAIYREVIHGDTTHERIDPPSAAAIDRHDNVFNIARIYVDQAGWTLTEGTGAFDPRHDRGTDGTDSRGTYWDVPIVTDATSLDVEIQHGDETVRISVPVKTGVHVFDDGTFANLFRFTLIADGAEVTAQPVEAEPPPPHAGPAMAVDRAGMSAVAEPAVIDADAAAELAKLRPDRLPANANCVEYTRLAIQMAAGLDPDAAVIDAIYARTVGEAPDLAPWPVGAPWLADAFPGTWYATSRARTDLTGTLADADRTLDELEVDGQHAVATGQHAIEQFFADEANRGASVVIHTTRYDPADEAFRSHLWLARRDDDGNVYYFDLHPSTTAASRDWLYLPGWGPGLDGVAAVELHAVRARPDGTLHAVDLAHLPGLFPLDGIHTRRPEPQGTGPADPPPEGRRARNAIDLAVRAVTAYLDGRLAGQPHVVAPTVTHDVPDIADVVNEIELYRHGAARFQSFMGPDERGFAGWQGVAYLEVTKWLRAAGAGSTAIVITEWSDGFDITAAEFGGDRFVAVGLVRSGSQTGVPVGAEVLFINSDGEPFAIPSLVRRESFTAPMTPPYLIGPPTPDVNPNWISDLISRRGEVVAGEVVDDAGADSQIEDEAAAQDREHHRLTARLRALRAALREATQRRDRANIRLREVLLDLAYPADSPTVIENLEREKSQLRAERAVRNAEISLLEHRLAGEQVGVAPAQANLGKDRLTELAEQAAAGEEPPDAATHPSAPEPEHLGDDAAAARLPRDADGADLHHVATLEWDGTGSGLLTTARGAQGRVVIEVGPTPDRIPARHTPGDSTDLPTRRITISERQAVPSNSGSADEEGRTELANEQDVVRAMGEIERFAIELDTRAELDWLPGQLDQARAAVAALVREPGMNLKRREALLAALDTARSVVATVDEASRLGPAAAARITLLADRIDRRYADNAVVSGAMQTVRVVADALSDIVPTTTDWLVSRSGDQARLTAEGHRVANELRVSLRLSKEWNQRPEGDADPGGGGSTPLGFGLLLMGPESDASGTVDHELLAIAQLAAPLAEPAEHGSAGDLVARRVGTHLELQQKVEAYRRAHPDRAHLVHGFDLLGAKATWEAGPVFEQEIDPADVLDDTHANRVDVGTKAWIIAKWLWVAASADDKTLPGLPGQVGDIRNLPDLLVSFVEPTPSGRTADLASKHTADGIIAAVVVGEPLNVTLLSAKFAAGLVDWLQPSSFQVRRKANAQGWGLAAPTHEIHRRYAKNLARAQADHRLAALSAELAFLWHDVAEARRTEPDGSPIVEGIFRLVTPQADEVDRTRSLVRDLAANTRPALADAHTSLDDLYAAWSRVSTMRALGDHAPARAARMLAHQLAASVSGREPYTIPDVMRMLDEYHEHGRSGTWFIFDSDVLVPASLMNHRVVAGPGSDQLHQHDEAIVRQALERFGPRAISAIAPQIPIKVLTARHLANPSLYQAYLRSWWGGFIFDGAMFVLPYMLTTDLIAGLIFELTPRPSENSTPVGGGMRAFPLAEHALHWQFMRWLNLRTYYRNLVAEQQRYGMSHDLAIDLALPPGVYETYASDDIRREALARHLLQAIPAKLGTTIQDQAQQLVQHYLDETDAASEPSVPIAASLPADASPLQPEPGPDEIVQSRSDEARLALLVQLVLWRDAKEVYDRVVERLEAGEETHPQMGALMLPADVRKTYADAHPEVTLYEKLPPGLKSALSPEDAADLVNDSLKPDGPIDAATAPRIARHAVQAALHLQPQRWRHLQTVRRELVDRLVDSGIEPRDAAALTQPHPSTRYAPVPELTAVLDQIPSQRWNALPLGEVVTLLWPYLRALIDHESGEASDTPPPRPAGSAVDTADPDPDLHESEDTTDPPAAGPDQPDDGSDDDGGLPHLRLFERPNELAFRSPGPGTVPRTRLAISELLGFLRSQALMRGLTELVTALDELAGADIRIADSLEENRRLDAKGRLAKTAPGDAPDRPEVLLGAATFDTPLDLAKTLVHEAWHLPHVRQGRTAQDYEVEAEAVAAHQLVYAFDLSSVWFRADGHLETVDSAPTPAAPMPRLGTDGRTEWVEGPPEAGTSAIVPARPRRQSVVHADTSTPLRATLERAWQDALAITSDPAQIAIAAHRDIAQPGIAQPGYVDLIASMAADTVVFRPHDPETARAVFNPPAAELLRERPRLAALFRDPDLSNELANLIPRLRDAAMSGGVEPAAGDLRAQPDDLRSQIAQLGANPGRPTLISRLGGDRAAHDDTGELEDDLWWFAQQVDENPELEELFTGVIPFGDLGHPIILTADASDHVILGIGAPVHKQPEVVIVVADRERAARLERTAVRHTAPAHIADLTDDERAEVLRGLYDGTLPVRELSQPGPAARFWRVADTIKRLLPHVKSVERRGAGWYLITTLSGAEMIVGFDDSLPSDDRPDYVEYVAGADRSASLFTIRPSTRDYVTGETFDDRVSAELAEERFLAIAASHLEQFTAHADALAEARGQLDRAADAVALLSDRSVDPRQRNNLLGSIVTALEATPAEARERGVDTARGIKALAEEIGRFAARYPTGRYAVTAAMLIARDAADSLLRARVSQSTANSPLPVREVHPTLTYWFRLAIETRVLERLAQQWKPDASVGPLVRRSGRRARRRQIGYRRKVLRHEGGYPDIIETALTSETASASRPPDSDPTIAYKRGDREEFVAQTPSVFPESDAGWDDVIEYVQGILDSLPQATPGSEALREYQAIARQIREGLPAARSAAERYRDAGDRTASPPPEVGKLLDWLLRLSNLIRRTWPPDSQLRGLDPLHPEALMALTAGYEHDADLNVMSVARMVAFFMTVEEADKRFSLPEHFIGTALMGLALTRDGTEAAGQHVRDINAAVDDPDAISISDRDTSQLFALPTIRLTGLGVAVIHELVHLQDATEVEQDQSLTRQQRQEAAARRAEQIAVQAIIHYTATRYGITDPARVVPEGDRWLIDATPDDIRQRAARDSGVVDVEAPRAERSSSAGGSFDMPGPHVTRLRAPKTTRRFQAHQPPRSYEQSVRAQLAAGLSETDADAAAAIRVDAMIAEFVAGRARLILEGRDHALFGLVLDHLPDRERQALLRYDRGAKPYRWTDTSTFINHGDGEEPQFAPEPEYHHYPHLELSGGPTFNSRDLTYLTYRTRAVLLAYLAGRYPHEFGGPDGAWLRAHSAAIRQGGEVVAAGGSEVLSAHDLPALDVVITGLVEVGLLDQWQRSKLLRRARRLWLNVAYRKSLVFGTGRAVVAAYVKGLEESGMLDEPRTGPAANAEAIYRGIAATSRRRLTFEQLKVFRSLIAPFRPTFATCSNCEPEGTAREP